MRSLHPKGSVLHTSRTHTNHHQIYHFSIAVVDARLFPGSSQALVVTADRRCAIVTLDLFVRINGYPTSSCMPTAQTESTKQEEAAQRRRSGEVMLNGLFIYCGKDVFAELLGDGESPTRAAGQLHEQRNEDDEWVEVSHLIDVSKLESIAYVLHPHR